MHAQLVARKSQHQCDPPCLLEMLWRIFTSPRLSEITHTETLADCIAIKSKQHCLEIWPLPRFIDSNKSSISCWKCCVAANWGSIWMHPTVPPVGTEEQTERQTKISLFERKTLVLHLLSRDSHNLSEDREHCSCHGFRPFVASQQSCSHMCACLGSNHPTTLTLLEASQTKKRLALMRMGVLRPWILLGHAE